MELTDCIIAYEQGDLSDDETVRMFQRLIDSGLAWRLQGHYGRTARNYLDRGLCVRGVRNTLAREG